MTFSRRGFLELCGLAGAGALVGCHAEPPAPLDRLPSRPLGRSGLTRLCYCGPVLHTRPARPHATREPLQFGAEIYGHLEKVVDGFEDIANRVTAIVIEHH